MSKKRVLIIGGGSGGAILANLLNPDEYDVTVIDKSRYHTFQPGQLFVAFQGSRKEFQKPIRCLLRDEVKFVNKAVSEVNLDDRYVVTSDGARIEYDYVIIATGVHLDYDAIKGNREILNEYGDYFSSIADAKKLWNTLRKLRKGTFFIGVADPLYKCPPAPHKAAFLSTNLFRRMGVHDKVKVILGMPFPHAYPSKTVSDIIEPKLEERGIEVKTYFTVDSIDTKEKKIYSLEGDEVKYDVATVVPVNTGPKIKVTPEKVLDDTGFFKVDKFKLNIEGYDDAFAIGDCSNVPTSKSGVTAHLHAEVVADRLHGLDSVADGRTHCPIVSNGEGTFVISDYNHPPLPIRMSKFKRLQEDIFIATYWVAVKYPKLMQPIFRSYFEATRPGILSKVGW